MRICGGTARGKTILIPRSGRIRVTTDRVKESLFNILGPLEGCSFLDIFAGSGNVGIEALSRGVEKVSFIENNARHAAAIRNNLERCGFKVGYDLMAVSFETGISLLGERRAKFDVIFADPPYEKDLVAGAVAILEKNDILTPDGMLVIEHSIRERCSDCLAFKLEDQRRYGDTVLSFMKTHHRGDAHE